MTSSYSWAFSVALATLGCAAASAPQAAEPDSAPPSAAPSSAASAAEPAAAPAAPAPGSESPPSATAAEPASDGSSAAAAPGAGQTAPPATASTAADAATPPQASAPPERRLADLLTGRDLAFMIDYLASAPRSAAETACADKAGDDPQKRAECMSKARSDFQADVLRFRKDPQGRVTWITYRRAGNTLTELHTVRVEIGEQRGDTLTLQPKAPETGKRLLFRGARQVTLSMPDDATLVIEDPALGRLVYKAKIGLIGQ